MPKNGYEKSLMDRAREWARHNCTPDMSEAEVAEYIRHAVADLRAIDAVLRAAEVR